MTNHQETFTMTDDQHPRGGGPMLDRALEPHPAELVSLFERPGDTPGPRGSAPWWSLEDDVPNPLLEAVADALAASYRATTFGTAAALIDELEAAGFRIEHHR